MGKREITKVMTMSVAGVTLFEEQAQRGSLARRGGEGAILRFSCRAGAMVELEQIPCSHDGFPKNHLWSSFPFIPHGSPTLDTCSSIP